MTCAAAFGAYAAQLEASGVVFDPWFQGEPRFRQAPLLLSGSTQTALYDAARATSFAYEAVCRLCQVRPELVRDELGLTEMQSLMWAASAPLWHGIARADVFLTHDGPAVCELNSDTPTGQPEAVTTGEIAHRQELAATDPNGRLRGRYLAMVEGYRRALAPQPNLRCAAIVYPTELTEDLGWITLCHRWLSEAGYEVVMGSPFNLREAGPTGVVMWDRPCDVVIRHYKTDWWGERQSAWTQGEEFGDEAPLTEPLGILLRASLAGTVAIVNPFGAVLPQNKRTMAMMWEHLGELPQAAQDAIRRFIPQTMRMELLDAATLRAERDKWVLKSDYGCEGDQVFLGCDCDDEEWASVIEHAAPRRWVAQRRFEVLPTHDGATMNYGVYVVAGEPCGMLCRSHKGATDPAAVVVPVLVEGEP